MDPAPAARAQLSAQTGGPPPGPAALGVIARYTSGYYYGAMLGGIHQVTSRAGVPLLVVQGVLQDLRTPICGAGHVAGWLVMHPMEGDADNLRALCDTGLPVVTIATALETVACSSVVVDNYGDTRALVRHLIDHGHRRIGCIIHGDTDSWSLQRYQGYAAALEERGLPLDPALVFRPALAEGDASAAGVHSLTRSGEIAARELVARGLPCSALVAGCDLSAIGAMRVLHAAGYRVPDDIAVVGFDDIAEAQYAQPSLTTVRTRFDQFGRAAAEHLLDVLRGERGREPARIFVPSTLLRRRSCGCAGVEEILAQSGGGGAAPADWKASLVGRLGLAIAYPLGPGAEHAQRWPGAADLVDALDAALQGRDTGALAARIDEAAAQAVAITENQELLGAAVALLERAAEQRIGMTRATTRPAVAALLNQVRAALTRASLAREAEKSAYLLAAGLMHQDMSLTLLASRAGESQTLAWLQNTRASWGCVGLWVEPHPGERAPLVVAGVYQRGGAPSVAVGARYEPPPFPPLAALPPAARSGRDLIIMRPLRASGEDFGMLVLCGFGDHNFSIDTESLWVQAALLAATLKRDAMLRDLETRTAELTRARDAAEAASQAKSAFLARMSHELRTPLNAILGYAQILQQQPPSGVAARGPAIIQQSGEHLLNLINDILDLAKIEASHLELTPSDVQLPAFLSSIVEIMRARAEAKRLALRFESPPGLPARVRADETRLRQVLLNLLGNAVKYTDAGHVTFRVSAEAGGQPADEPAVALRFEVADTGIGIAADQLERVFQPFEQVETPARHVEGTGLGLAISRQLVQLMGGELRVRSELGRGSAFWFSVALPVVERAPQGAGPAERAVAGYAGARRSVLVVDDIPSNRAILVDMLRPLGLRVLEAEDGRQAVELVRRQRPDIILMDRWMPVFSGPETVRQIRALPDAGALPIIATSASVAAEDRDAMREAGYDDFLPKPVRRPELLALLRRFLQIEWLYAAEEAAGDAPGAALPPEELARLAELAEVGDILALQRRLAELGGARPDALLQRLAQLAGAFELDQLRALLAQSEGR